MGRRAPVPPAPTVEEALRALDDWAAEHARVTARLVAETMRAKGMEHEHDDGPDR